MIQLNPPNKGEIDQRIEQLSSLYTGKDAIYISGAITTGKNYVSWYVNHGKRIENEVEFNKQHYSVVITKNLDNIKDFTANLRFKSKDLIIEPASLEVDEWTQPDYLYYWGQVIIKFVRKIVFLDGWNYSNGCIFEYYIGLKNNIELVDQKFKLLNQVNAISRIKASIREYEKSKINVEFQKTLLHEIEKNENYNQQTKV
ncbi:MAG: hypothetical protein EHM93_14715 [Bacteroidales bacterium]|nr:MAG: hypothetical protein EHM93_14715 [Bacteroidales bacterium]